MLVLAAVLPRSPPINYILIIKNTIFRIKVSNKTFHVILRGKHIDSECADNAANVLQQMSVMKEALEGRHEQFSVKEMQLLNAEAGLQQLEETLVKLAATTAQTAAQEADVLGDLQNMPFTRQAALENGAKEFGQGRKQVH